MWLTVKLSLCSMLVAYQKMSYYITDFKEYRVVAAYLYLIKSVEIAGSAKSILTYFLVSVQFNSIRYRTNLDRSETVLRIEVLILRKDKIRKNNLKS